MFEGFKSEPSKETLEKVEKIKKIFTDNGYTIVKDKLSVRQIMRGVDSSDLMLYMKEPLKAGSEKSLERQIRDLLDLDDSPRVEFYPTEDGLEPVGIDLFD